MESPVGPVAVEVDGWSVSSYSSDATPESIKAQLTETIDPAADAKAAAAVNPIVNPQGVESTPGTTAAAATETPAAAAATPAAATPVVAATDAAATPKRQSWQSRFDEERARSGQFERDFVAEKTRREELEKRLERLEAAGRTTPAAPASAVSSATPAAAAAAATQVKPEPSWTEYEKQGKSWDQYQIDRDQWVFAESERRGREAAIAATEERFKTERETAEQTRQKGEAQAAQQARERELGGRLDAMRARRPDFDKIVEANLGDIKSPVIDHIVTTNKLSAEILLHLAEHRQDAQTLERLFASPDVKRGLADAIATSDVPTKLLAHFAQKPEDFQRIAKLDAISGVRELTKLEVGFAGAPATTTATVPSVTNAAPPLRVVSGGQTPRPGDTAKQLEDTEFGPQYVHGMNNRDREQRRQRVG